MEVDVLWICSVIAAFGAAVVALSKLGKPIKGLIDRIDDHDKTLERIDRKVDRMEAVLGVMLKNQVAICNHTIDGNHIEKLKESRDELEDSLIRLMQDGIYDSK